MIAGESVAVNTESFTNDMEHSYQKMIILLTPLIHLISHDDKQTSYDTPTSEIRQNMNTVSVSDWGSVSKALKDSADTLNAIWQGREEQVAKVIEQAHFETSHIQYNDEKCIELYNLISIICSKEFLYDS